MVDAAAALREKLTEIKGLGPAAQYGLFLADEDPKKGVWLEPGRTLEHYLLRENVSRCFLIICVFVTFVQPPTFPLPLKTNHTNFGCLWSLDEIGWLAASWRYLVEAKSGSLDVPWGHVVPAAWRR